MTVEILTSPKTEKEDPKWESKATTTTIYKNLIGVEVVAWKPYDSAIAKSFGLPEIVFNYYITIYENKTPAKLFRELWLPDKQVDFGGSHVHITHDYDSCRVADLNWHGGITYYNKYGETPGHRSIKFGCDYNHLADRDVTYTVEQVKQEALSTAAEMLDLFRAFEAAQSQKADNPANLASPANKPC